MAYLVAFFLFIFPSTADAQMVCGERVEIVSRLEDGYKEKKIAEGIAGNGALLSVFTSAAGTWTITIAPPGGPTCLIWSGEEWEGWQPVFVPEHEA